MELFRNNHIRYPLKHMIVYIPINWIISQIILHLPLHRRNLYLNSFRAILIKSSKSCSIEEQNFQKVRCTSNRGMTNDKYSHQLNTHDHWHRRSITSLERELFVFLSPWRNAIAGMFSKGRLQIVTERICGEVVTQWGREVSPTWGNQCWKGVAVRSTELDSGKFYSQGL